MKIKLILLAVAVVAVIGPLTACKKRGVQGDVDAAIARQHYQFVALLDPDGKWTYPQVPYVPDWYFQEPGNIRVMMTKPETKAADVAYMKSYNDALYQTLKSQGMFHNVILEGLARARMDNYNQPQTNSADK